MIDEAIANEWMADMDALDAQLRLTNFVRESNRIEGIDRPPTVAEILAHTRFLAGDVSIKALERFVDAVQPDALLRRHESMNVRVNTHIAPKGGEHIEEWLRHLITKSDITPYERHCAYQTLHPFTDGNGRSGRVLWLHDMGGIQNVPFGFLHTFYYQTLDHSDGRKPR